ncbi:class I SAM-dependent methyltransferase [Herbidospora cretacea]|uniref:class I SAM-dependent methyltransferase n=1 Tax=Herbidospora cretacea TaxID=28444 RepID=UPI00068D2358|nr:class I SAM-dependent methyltransferase [Herbidospora cretacea]
MAQLPDLLHRTLFRTISLLTPYGQSLVLRRYFDWWHRSPDPWLLASSPYEQRKYEETLKALPDRTYRTIIDVGCSEGVFTGMLAAARPEAEITGVDISETALTRARRNAPSVRFVQSDLFSLTGHYDLVVCSETLYYLGGRLEDASDRLCGLLAPEATLVSVHPWPEARRLHRFFEARLDPGGERIIEDTDRPFVISCYFGTGRRG